MTILLSLRRIYNKLMKKETNNNKMKRTGAYLQRKEELLHKSFSRSFTEFYLLLSFILEHLLLAYSFMQN